MYVYYRQHQAKQQKDTNQLVTQPQKIIQQQKMDQISILTYNVWFEDQNFDLRTVEILKIIEQKQATYVCLQEVTQRFMQHANNNQYIKQNYYITNNKRGWYGTVIFQKINPASVIQIPFPSGMERDLLYTITNVNGKELIIATSHLESLNNSKLRYEQLQISYKQFEQYQNVIMMGDFNFDGEENKQNLSDQYIDIWPFLRQETGNTMKQTSKFAAWRPDRIIMKKGGYLTPSLIEIVGDYDIPFFKDKEVHPDIVKTPSDHLGLYAVFTLQQ
ncbi:hypothetical protein pb186bvf_011025 [Paramecium bursaria]